MALLEQEQVDQLKEIFENLDGEVKMVFFGSDEDCEHCGLARDILTEVADLSDKIELTVKDFEKDKEDADKLGIDKSPATAIMGERDYGLRFYGVPAGYEFTPLIEDIISVSVDSAGISEEAEEELGKVDAPIHLQVFTTPTCPYCPKAVRAAHSLAMASDLITADMVESSEFPELVEKFEVSGVPHTVINDEYGFIGPLPDTEVVYEILRFLGKPAPPRPVYEVEHTEGVEGGHEHHHDHEEHEEHDH